MVSPDVAPVSSKEFLEIQATKECRFTMKRVRDMIITYVSQVKKARILCETINRIHATGLFLYALNTSENRWYRKGPRTWNKLTSI